MNDAILPADLDRLLVSGARVRVLDVRRAPDRVAIERPIPGAQWRDPERVEDWARALDAADEVIVYCVHGHQVSRSVRDALRARGLAARILEGGIEAWCAHAGKKA